MLPTRKAGIARLARAHHLARPSNLKVALGHLKAVARLFHYRQTLARLGRSLMSREQDAEGLLVPAPDPPAKLVELRKAEPLGVLDYHHARVGHVDADLYHGSRHEYVNRAARNSSITASFSSCFIRPCISPTRNFGKTAVCRCSAICVALSRSSFSDSSTSG